MYYVILEKGRGPDKKKRRAKNRFYAHYNKLKGKMSEGEAFARTKTWAKSQNIDVTKWGKDWPADPKVQYRSDTPPIDKIIKESIKAGDMFASVKKHSLRLRDKKKKKGEVEEGPEDEGIPEGIGPGEGISESEGEDSEGTS